MLKPKLKAYLQSLEAQHLKRAVRLVPSDHLNFSSNDYLELAQNPILKAAYQKAFEQYPIGSTGSMLVSGYHETHEALQDAFSNALNTDAALLFPSGYAANLSIMQLLAKLDLHALIDKNIHASIYDGLRLSGGTYTRYRLTPPPPEDNSILLTEGIFSMSGAIPNLTALAKAHPLIIDEAHAFGVLGPNGLGSVAAHQLTQTSVPLRIIPFGKALGATGAMVAGNKDWIEALLQTARPLIYSTAMSPALAGGLLTALQLLQQAEPARLALQKNIQYFKTHIKNSALTWQDSNSPIQQLQLGCPEKALAYQQKLQANHIHCIPMRVPTVPRAHTGLRIVLSSAHTPKNIQQLFECLAQCHASI